MVFTVLMSKAPKPPDKAPIGTTADGRQINMVTEGIEKPVNILCIFSSFYGLRVLMNCFSYVGNFKVKTKLFANDPSKKPLVFFFPFGLGLWYADFGLRKTFEKAPPGTS